VKQTYRVVAGLVALGVVVQASAIAFGWFDALNKIDNGLVVDKNYDGNVGHAIHGLNGMYIMPLLGLILLIVSFFAKVPEGVKWAAMVFVGILVQVALGIFGHSLPAVGFIHGFFALLLFWLAWRTAQQASVVEADLASREDAVTR
jgi:hypothetical protein